MSTHVVYQVVVPVCMGFIYESKADYQVFEEMRIRLKQKFKQDG